MLLPLSTFLLSSLLIHTTSAGYCSRIPPTPCGEVDNTSGRTLTYTTQLLHGPDLCALTELRFYPNDKPVPCKQEHLLDQGHAGGHDVDVDAFTFDDEDYWVVRHRATYKMQKGTWTLVGGTKQARCYTSARARGYKTAYQTGPFCEIHNHLAFSFYGDR
ncbi:MAG: hypothetical protein M1816_001605 [Peltula sp. TS41687]|nr:MAG: hypothetical protein M1816_001605 [Peltula sp. TS41687]